ncbi:MAG: hypothetical protein ACTSWY_15170, partial [Promethearchaeota archaeon]
KLDNLLKDDGTVIIPDLSVQYKKYSKWDFKAYDHAVIEKKYLHKVAKSTNLIPFLLLKNKLIYLPLDLFGDKNWTKSYFKAKRNKQAFKPYFGDSKKSEKHYQFLNNLYKQNIKSGGAITDLFQNINHNNKLLNLNQKETFKVVYNGIGSIVKGAIEAGDFIIDSSLYYTIPDSEEEAYYLIGIFNTPIMTELVKLMGSTGINGSLRNIHKNPLNTNIPKYNGTLIQNRIIKYSKKMEELVKDFLIKYIADEISSIMNEKEKNVCIKCGMFISNRYYLEHIKNCKKNKNYILLKTVYDSLTKEEKGEIKNIHVIRKTIFNFTEFQLDGTEELQILKFRRYRLIYNHLIMPKSIQGRLFKDKKFLSMNNELNEIVRTLLK